MLLVGLGSPSDADPLPVAHSSSPSPSPADTCLVLSKSPTPTVCWEQSLSARLILQSAFYDLLSVCFLLIVFTYLLVGYLDIFQDSTLDFSVSSILLVGLLLRPYSLGARLGMRVSLGGGGTRCVSFISGGTVS